MLTLELCADARHILQLAHEVFPCILRKLARSDRKKYIFLVAITLQYRHKMKRSRFEIFSSIMLRFLSARHFMHKNTACKLLFLKIKLLNRSCIFNLHLVYIGFKGYRKRIVFCNIHHYEDRYCFFVCVGIQYHNIYFMSFHLRLTLIENISLTRTYYIYIL